jgi:NDP-sugar pyrophosphorylase family protein|nr:nucleotidyltransferase [Candidatus Krumholzibacteria bacterium]
MPSSLSLVVMAAGRARRYGGLKQLEGFGPAGQTILDYTLCDALRAGVSRAVLVISSEHEHEFRKQIVEPWSSQLDVVLVEQRLEDLPALPVDGPGPSARPRPWGTGHALWAARHAVDGPFILANADDFYGQRALAAVAEHLRSGRGWALQAYALGDTLPTEDGFSRGFCTTDADGWLQTITETLDVRRATMANPCQPVSMNLWGLEPAVFDLLEEEFRNYLSAHGQEPDREFYLPHAIGAGIDQECCRVKVLPPCDQWFGVTHPDDAPAVRQQLKALHSQGVYPEDLHA